MVLFKCLFFLIGPFYLFIYLFLIGPYLKQTLHFGLYSSRTPYFSYIDFLDFLTYNILLLGFPCGSVVKNLLANEGDAGDVGSIPGSGRSPGGGNDNPLQNSWLENSMNSRAWQAVVHGAAKSGTWLSNWAHTFTMFFLALKTDSQVIQSISSFTNL